MSISFCESCVAHMYSTGPMQTVGCCPPEQGGAWLMRHVNGAWKVEGWAQSTCCPSSCVGAHTPCGGCWWLQVGQQSVVDLSSEEEPCATAALRIAVNAHGRVMGISKAGSGGIHPTLTQVRPAALTLSKGHLHWCPWKARLTVMLFYTVCLPK
jgi:hypothetical protein